MLIIIKQYSLFIIVSETTARNWLKKMGYRYKKYQKGVYIDGHEHEDVVEYRKTFLKEMEL